MTTTPARMLYLACPYRDADPAVERERLGHAAHVLRQAVDAGVCLYSPLNHLDAVSTAPYRRYYRHGLQMLRRADIVVVLKLRGWQSSTGVQLEVRAAERLGVDVIYLDEFWCRTDWPWARHTADGLQRLLRQWASEAPAPSSSESW